MWNRRESSPRKFQKCGGKENVLAFLMDDKSTQTGWGSSSKPVAIITNRATLWL